MRETAPGATEGNFYATRTNGGTRDSCNCSCDSRGRSNNCRRLRSQHHPYDQWQHRRERLRPSHFERAGGQRCLSRALVVIKLTFKGTTGNADGGTSFLFDYLISNTSSTTLRVTAFGFDITPLTSFDLAKSKPGTGETYDIQSSGSLANNSLDFCLKNGQDNNCGGSQGGPAAGSSGSGTFRLYFDTTRTSLTLSNILDRYQGIDGPPGSAEGFVTNTPPVPEPATWAMMLVGFGGIGVAMRRRRKGHGKLLQVA